MKKPDDARSPFDTVLTARCNQELSCKLAAHYLIEKIHVCVSPPTSPVAARPVVGEQDHE